MINSDIVTDPLWSGSAEQYRRMALRHGLHTAWSVPIVSENGTLLGTFGLHHTKAHSVGADELELLEEAGHIALIAIERDRAQAALTEAFAEVRKSESELRTVVDMPVSHSLHTIAVGVLIAARCRCVRRRMSQRIVADVRTR